MIINMVVAFCAKCMLPIPDSFHHFKKCCECIDRRKTAKEMGWNLNFPEGYMEKRKNMCHGLGQQNNREIHEGWHETDFNRLLFVQSIAKEIYKDMENAISKWVKEEYRDKLHFSEIMSEVFSKYIDINKTDGEIVQDQKI